MRVLFNTTAALEGTSGFSQTIELLGALSRLPAGHRYQVLTTTAQAPLRDALGGRFEHILVDAPRSGLARTPALWAKLPGIVRGAKADVVYNRGNFYAPRLPCPQICLIENANPFSSLDVRQPLAFRARNRLLRAMSEAAFARAAAVVFPSHTMHQAIASRYDMRARAFVIAHGSGMPEPATHERPFPEPYILLVSSLFPFKNLSVGIRALDRLRRSGVFLGQLVIVGDQGPPAYVRSVMREISSLGLESVVRIERAVPRGILSAWYRHAALALTTSLEESFGLPVVEAMALGVPVVVPDKAPPHRYFLPFRELCGDSAEYFDPFDVADCAAAMARALLEPRRSAMVSGGLLRARAYTWEAAARHTAEMLTALDASRSCSGSAPDGTTGTAP